ncbi:MAG: hypothetical protein V1944_00470 [Candidatus Aenigmatarchaeota archaeon]
MKSPTLPKIDEQTSWRGQISRITQKFVNYPVYEHPLYPNTIAVIRRTLPHSTALDLVKSCIQARRVNDTLPYFRLMIYLFDKTEGAISATQKYEELSPYKSYLIEMLGKEKEFGISFFKEFHRYNYILVSEEVEYPQL